VQRRNRACLGTAAALLGAIACLALTSPAWAATREPLALARAGLHAREGVADPAARPDRAALRALLARSRARISDVGGAAVKMSSTYYGPEQEAEIAAVLDRLDHGPEMAQLSVYVATPEELTGICGAEVVACYLPTEMEMVVSGVDQTVAGVPRDFAIAHEYGHHLANTQRGEFLSALEGGTIRWATYERVCQLTRSGQLFPGDQGSHYWQNPEEAYAESYAHLTDPGAAVPWQFTSLLQPTTASLAKIQADLERPWQGPTTTTLSGAVAEAPVPPARTVSGPHGTGLSSGVAVGIPPGAYSSLVQTPLDGQVSVAVQAPPGVSLAVSLQDPQSGRTLARAGGEEGGAVELSYANCGHDALRLTVVGLHGAGSFQATVTKP
jgi:hypothetical protein